jgi:hypothetical protein
VSPIVQVRTESADLTGEDVATIRRLGFSPIDLADNHFDRAPDRLPPNCIDSDELALLCKKQPLG